MADGCVEIIRCGVSTHWIGGCIRIAIAMARPFDQERVNAR